METANRSLSAGRSSSPDMPMAKSPRATDCSIDAKGNFLGCTNEGDEKIIHSPVYSGNSENRPFGGDVLVEGSAEVLFPLPFIKDQRSVRTGVVLDFGNVFDPRLDVYLEKYRNSYNLFWENDEFFILQRSIK